MHWAADLIGRPWSPDGEGPTTFSCWGLTRWVFRTRYGIDMPAIALGDFGSGANVAAIKQAASVSGWRPTEPPPQDGDIVLMDGENGRHVGVMIEVDRKLRLLHADGMTTIRGSVGAVAAQPLEDVLYGGRYFDLELWRKT